VRAPPPAANDSEPDPKRIIVHPDQIVQPDDLRDDTPLRKHVVAAMMLSAILLFGMLLFGGLLLLLNAKIGH